MPRSTAPLFTPFAVNGLTLANRIVMAPMTRAHSKGAVPDAENAAYYRRRAQHGCGLIITEGTTVDHKAASVHPDIPRFHGADALAGWKRVVDEVHEAGGKVFPQLWHGGMARIAENTPNPHVPSAGPSGLNAKGEKKSEPLSRTDIRLIVDAFARAAVSARELGFDGIEVHGAHGYLIDSFFWERMNQRDDEYGGDMLKRTRFAVEIIEAIRREIGHDFPLLLRLSQWKRDHYDVKLAQSAEEWAQFLAPLSAAGVDMFHCSTRRFGEPQYEDSPLPVAALTKKLTGKPVITVGGVGLSGVYHDNLAGGTSEVAGLDDLIARFERGEFDLVAVGRALLNDPEWTAKIRDGRYDALKPFDAGGMEKYY